MNDDQIRCPKCESTQVTANKKGFSGAKALVGGVMTGGIGMLAGTIGSNKVYIFCMACGHKFKPGEDYNAIKLKKETEEQNMQDFKEMIGGIGKSRRLENQRRKELGLPEKKSYTLRIIVIGLIAWWLIAMLRGV